MLGEIKPVFMMVRGYSDSSNRSLELNCVDESGAKEASCSEKQVNQG